MQYDKDCILRLAIWIPLENRFGSRTQIRTIEQSEYQVMKVWINIVAMFVKE